MALDNILAISKKPGLYKLINPSRGGYIVESFLDQKRTFVKRTVSPSVNTTASTDII